MDFIDMGLDFGEGAYYHDEEEQRQENEDHPTDVLITELEDIE
jgi:hypothetical protein